MQELLVGLDDGVRVVAHGDAPFVHPDRLVAELADRAQAVADEDDRPRLRAELAHLLEGLLPEARIAGGERFVDHEDVRIHVDGHRESEAPVHPRRVGAHRHVHEVAELGEVRDVLVLGRHLRPSEACGEAAEDDVLPARELALEADPEREQRAHPPEDLHAPSARRQDSRHRAEEGRFSGAVDPDDPEDGAVRDLERHVADRPDLPDDPLAAPEADECLLQRRLLLDAVR